MIFLVAFDISSDKARRKVNKHLKAYGYRVQKSVYEVDLTPADLDLLMNSLGKLIEKGDSIRIYAQTDSQNPLCIGDENGKLDLPETVVF